MVVPCRSEESREKLKVPIGGTLWTADYNLLNLTPCGSSVFTDDPLRLPMKEFADWIRARLGKLDAIVRACPKIPLFAEKQIF